MDDGRNYYVDKTDLTVNDSVLIDLVNDKFETELKLKEGSLAFILSGKHCSEVSEIKRIIPGTVNRETLIELERKDGTSFQTLKKYVMVVGEKKPIIEL